MPSIPLTRQPWLYLNDLGERFCNEDMPYAFVCRAHNAQPRHMKWVFWDSKWEIDGPAMGMVVCKDFRSPLHNPEEIQQFIEEGTILSADTIDGLLAKMEGIDAETAKASIERYNELCAAGVDEDFGKRRQCLSSLTEPPSTPMPIPSRACGPPATARAASSSAITPSPSRVPATAAPAPVAAAPASSPPTAPRGA